jgi:hypothetical protein
MPIVGAGAVKAGKPVVLTAEHPGLPNPRSFTVYRDQGELVRRFRTWRGKPALPIVDRLPAHGAGQDPMWSDTWTLPARPGRRSTWRLLFEDDLLHQSPVLHVSRLGSITLKSEVEARVPVVPGPSARYSREVTAIAAVDPLVDVSVMTPWGDGADDFSSYLHELATDASDDGEDPEAVAEAFREYLAPHLPSEPPLGWQFRLSHPQLQLQAGEPADIRIELDAPNPGSTAFAIQMIATDTPDELAAASDLFIVEKTTHDEPAGLLTLDHDPSEWHPPSGD